MYAKNVVTGLYGNIDDSLGMPHGGIFTGKAEHRSMDRSLIDVSGLQQVYPAAMPWTSVGYSYDCDFSAPPQMFGQTMSFYDLTLKHKDILSYLE